MFNIGDEVIVFCDPESSVYSKGDIGSIMSHDFEDECIVNFSNNGNNHVVDDGIWYVFPPNLRLVKQKIEISLGTKIQLR